MSALAIGAIWFYQVMVFVKMGVAVARATGSQVPLTHKPLHYLS